VHDNLGSGANGRSGWMNMNGRKEKVSAFLVLSIFVDF
jgi:hypothetical protein